MRRLRRVWIAEGETHEKTTASPRLASSWSASSLAARALRLDARRPRPAAPEPVTPADFVASMADVAAGRTQALAETGLVLKRIEFRLVVGTETKAGGSIEILVLDAEAVADDRDELPPGAHARDPGVAAGAARRRVPLVPGVREFVEAAMNTARDLARATAAAGLPQRLKSVELTAKITRSRTLSRRHHGDDPGVGEARRSASRRARSRETRTP